jgi:hypothetical protein
MPATHPPSIQFSLDLGVMSHRTTTATDIKITESTLKEQFPAPRYRVSRAEYPAGTTFPCVISEGSCYVLSGACKYTGRAGEVILRAEEDGRLISGEHQFEVLGDSSVVLVHVWDLDHLRKA